jgi:cobalt/nickel transport system ATP-binding protein
MAEKIIEIKDLHYSYPDGTKALCGINLEVFRGESLGLIGPNGAGKSTLLLHLNGILRSNSAVKILGREVTDKNLPLIRGRVGLVFQDPENQLFMPTVFDDVGFGPINLGMKKADVQDAVKRALEDVDMLPSLKRSSHHLSVGEKKRVAIATVLSMGPEILVLDEPSSNLDPKHRRALIALIKNLPLTKVIATHDLSLVADTCSRIALLDGGRIIRTGETGRILSDRALLEGCGIIAPSTPLSENFNE